MIQEAEKHYRSTYEVLKEMDESGLLSEAIRKEIVPVTSAFHKFVYECYLKARRDGETKTQSVLMTSVEAQLSERSVWYIIKQMES